MPDKDKDEDDKTYHARLNNWEGINFKIITWFANISILSINMQFGDFDIAKEVLDFLAK